ncbi:MAG: hypothetical protein V4547_10880 [Bacteroidota bacterium]
MIFQKLVASPPDSLIRIADLSFKSEVQKLAFTKFALGKDSADPINLLLTPYDKESELSSAIVHQRVNDCLNYLQKEVENKPEVKKVKFIYDYVHKTFFKVYKLKNSFSDIFEKGEYNCVSATALYAIIFSKLGIPYQIKELPEHVYLIAYPYSTKILIETTNPEKGYYRVNDDIQKKYVKHLFDSKTISKQEYESSDINTLFNKYYFSSENISLIQLIGLQYSNYGLYDFEDKNYEVAISELKKAYFLYPSEGNKYTLKLFLSYQIANNSYNDQKQIDNLAILCRYNNLKDSEISNESIKGEFSRIIQTQLIDNSDFQKFEKSHATISGALTDSALVNDIDFSYHLELARLGYVNSKDSEFETNHLQAAFLINPHNANLQAIILGYFERRVQKHSEVKSILSLTEEYSRKFDFLNDNDEFNSIKANCLLELSYQSFSLNDITKGEAFLKDFENFCELKKELKPNPAFVERAFSVAASAYYKKGNYSKSKQFLKTGLKYAPDSFGLKQRLSQF